MTKIKIQKILKNITFKKSLELREAIIDAKTVKESFKNSGDLIKSLLS
ncbi:MAG: hypothetical protein Q8O59_04850 [bacterium]|nr:hypothetical protein [bacterium]